MEFAPFAPAVMKPQAAHALRFLDEVSNGHGPGQPSQQMHLVGNPTDLDGRAFQVVTDASEVSVQVLLQFRRLKIRATTLCGKDRVEVNLVE